MLDPQLGKRGIRTSIPGAKDDNANDNDEDQCVYKVAYFGRLILTEKNDHYRIQCILNRKRDSPALHGGCHNFVYP